MESFLHLCFLAFTSDGWTVILLGIMLTSSRLIRSLQVVLSFCLRTTSTKCWRLVNIRFENLEKYFGIALAISNPCWTKFNKVEFFTSIWFTSFCCSFRTNEERWTFLIKLLGLHQSWWIWSTPDCNITWNR